MHVVCPKILVLAMYMKEILRFCIVGFFNVFVQYVIYYIALFWTSHNIAYIIGYFVSFIVNYVLTTSYTFQTKRSIANGLGFVICHVINFLMQIGFLNIFIWLGIDKVIAPVPVFAICVPTNFLLVRWVMKRF